MCVSKPIEFMERTQTLALLDTVDRGGESVWFVDPPKYYGM
jgi:hypothetical protein